MRKYFRLVFKFTEADIKEDHREEMQIEEEEVKFLEKKSSKVRKYFLREAGNGAIQRRKSF